jgi:diadenosine tetraphosphate (Ap4A) HIT family hydrolase
MVPDPKSAGWTLDPQIERDTVPVGDMPLCRILLMNDANYPWLLLVPRRPAIVEIADLDATERLRLMADVADAAGTLKGLTGCDKINVASLGNVVAQLHVHIVARSRGDPAWPKSVWGLAPAKPYDEATARSLIAALRQRLALG